MADTAALTARIVALCDDIAGVNGADDEYPANLVTVLPFFFVEERGASYVWLNANEVEVTREWLLLLYVAEFVQDTSSPLTEDAARAAARPFLDTVTLFFSKRTRLQRSDQGLTDLKRATLAADDGLQTASRDSRYFSVIAWRLRVAYDYWIDEQV